jgi:mannan endo-1,6-alpha-mannosidase
MSLTTALSAKRWVSKPDLISIICPQTKRRLKYAMSTLFFITLLIHLSQGNDDQSSWALAALTAAERSFPPISSNSNESYLSLAEAVFEDQVARWDDKTCGGGLRWQIFTFNNGYEYKNSLSNGQFLALSARLARYTGNKTYSDWAEKAYTWSTTVGLVSSQGNVYDGTSATLNCSTANHIQWTSSAGTYLYGSAVMYNIVSPSHHV